MPGPPVKFRKSEYVLQCRLYLEITDPDIPKMSDLQPKIGGRFQNKFFSNYARRRARSVESVYSRSSPDKDLTIITIKLFLIQSRTTLISLADKEFSVLMFSA